MSDRYEWILAQANDWLKFAEAKNTGLVVFNSVVLVTSVQWIGEHPSTHLLLKLYLASLWTLVGTGLVIALFSFLPNTTIPLLTAGEQPSAEDNLIFFGAARKYNAADYAATLKSRYGIGAPGDTQWEHDVSEQVVTNARIAAWKYTCFKVALWVTIWGILTPLAGPLATGVLYAWSKAYRT